MCADLNKEIGFIRGNRPRRIAGQEDSNDTAFVLYFCYASPVWTKLSHKINNLLLKKCQFMCKYKKYPVFSFRDHYWFKYFALELVTYMS